MEKTRQTFVFDFNTVKFIFSETTKNTEVNDGRLSRLESLTDYLQEEVEKLKLSAKLKGARKVE